MRKFISSLIIISTTATILHAELIWNKGSGWTTEPHDGLTIKSDDFEALELMNEAKNAQEEKKFSTALAQYQKVYKRYSNSIFAPEAYYQIGKIREQKHQYKAAFKAFDTIINKYPQYPGFTKVLHEQFELASLLKSGSRPYYFGVIPGFKDRNAAIEFYEKIITKAPYNELAPLALLNIAELSLRDKKHVDAIEALDRLIDNYPDSEYTPTAYLKIAKIYSNLAKSINNDQGSIQEAVHYYEDFLILYPNHENVPEVESALDQMKTRLAMSKISIGDFYFQSRNNPKAALIMYKEAITCYPNSSIAETAKNKIKYVEAGNRPKKTPVDFLFGRYKRPDNEEWIQEAQIDEITNENFENKSESVFNMSDESVHNFSDSEQGAVNTNFSEETNEFSKEKNN